MSTVTTLSEEILQDEAYAVISPGAYFVTLMRGRSNRVYLADGQDASPVELRLKLVDQDLQKFAIYRVFVAELQISVFRNAHGNVGESPIWEVPGGVRLNLQQERFVCPELFVNKRLEGRQGFVLHIDGVDILSGSDDEFSHDSSLSVGDTPDGAVVGATESIERVQTLAEPETKAPSPAATGEGEETNPHGK